MLEVRSHARDLRSAVSPEGRTFRVDWMDPVVLDIILGAAAPDQLAAIFARRESLTVTAPQRWIDYRLHAGRLQRHAVNVMRAG
jgi:hypothetical protein